MTETSAPAPPGERVVRVWDLPTRLFHWALAVALIVTPWLSLKLLGRHVPAHVDSGHGDATQGRLHRLFDRVLRLSAGRAVTA